jgi:hypothetical protein
MHKKPTALIEGWRALYLHGRPHLLLDFVTDHCAYADIADISARPAYYILAKTLRELTINTLYSLRHRITEMAFEGSYPVRIGGHPPKLQTGDPAHACLS